MDWSELKKRNIDGKELVIAVVQNAEDMEVSMLGFQDREAFERTLKSGRIWLYSTSRKRLWQKGEISGNGMELREARVDCDRDSILYICRLEGPACHEGYDSCFHRDMNGRIIAERRFNPEEVY